MAVRRRALPSLAYDERFIGSHYREESDLQQRVKQLGWRLLYFPDLRAEHYGGDVGGSRGQDLGWRMFWKARNHTLFVRKNFGPLTQVKFLVVAIVLLGIYSPQSAKAIVAGIEAGFRVQ